MSFTFSPNVAVARQCVRPGAFNPGLHSTTAVACEEQRQADGACNVCSHNTSPGSTPSNIYPFAPSHREHPHLAVTTLRKPCV
eukprot:CAMPEP_0185836826 /NCGR_PEP_ID=MMETSP1353-20130828/10370_1 /TAXON_ID=1077150 /ORGANISM="Erythrolobus australicus, Strain CCMP3124" /LENGTH=82 /DNA_ID=CAMNT_0028535663 /DNA_START=230 /DNA_END=478 /DNA_ORIENTATION=-